MGGRKEMMARRSSGGVLVNGEVRGAVAVMNGVVGGWREIVGGGWRFVSLCTTGKGEGRTLERGIFSKWMKCCRE